MSSQRTIILTSALPYANGDIHLGHMLEHVMSDIWVRFQKMRGHECLHICAEDTHGTPIMVNARKQGITPEKLISEAAKSHIKDFAGFDIAFDNYSSTNTDLNRQVTEEIFHALNNSGAIRDRVIKQSYCHHDQMFLPDRFVKGICPKCAAEDQYGDNCEVCSASYTPADLKAPKCTLCGNAPELKDTQHLFVELDRFRDFLKEWVPAHTAPEVANKMNEWLGGNLQEWCISRDAPYFGFEIPGYAGKYFYVWMDAPVGYISSTWEWCQMHGRKIEEFWANPRCEIYHNIGKDIVYFHTLFWPAMLKASRYKTPDGIWVHGYLTVNGTKMSKSRGTFISAATYLKHLDPVYFRYYMACKLNGEIEDFDLNLEDFVSRVNSDLIGKITNVASRGAQMLGRIDGRMGTLSEEGRHLVSAAQERAQLIARYYEDRNYSRAIVEIRNIADEANRYFDSYEPWKLVKTDPEKTREILTTILNQFRLMAIYLKPVIPSYAARVERLFGEAPYGWDDHKRVLENYSIQPFEHLLGRLEAAKVQAIVEDSKQEAPDAKPVTKESKKSPEKEDMEAIAPEIEIDDFLKIDLRVARIVDAKEVEGASKLLALTLDIGKGRRQVMAGIRSAYQPEQLIGRLTVMVANLKSRKMKFGLSEGMVLAAGPGGKDLFILSPDSGAQPGQRIR